MPDVTPQDLDAAGLNPFAATLLAASWKRLPRSLPLAFRLDGVPMALGHDVAALRGRHDRLLRALREVGDWLGFLLAAPRGAALTAEGLRQCERLAGEAAAVIAEADAAGRCP